MRYNNSRKSKERMTTVTRTILLGIVIIIAVKVISVTGTPLHIAAFNLHVFGKATNNAKLSIVSKVAT